MTTDEKVSNLLTLALDGKDIAIGILKIYGLSHLTEGKPNDLKEIKRQLKTICKNQDLSYNTLFNGIANKYDAIIAKGLDKDESKEKKT